jgi:lantibiotic modifying enzyme
VASIEEYRQVGEQAWSWVLGHVRDDDGPWLPVSVEAGWESVGPPADRDSLYAGVAGLAPVLVEIAEARPWTDAEHRLRDGVVDRLCATVGSRSEPSLYDGLAGDVTALRMLSPTAASLALRRLEELSVPDGWVTTLEVAGEAGRCLHDVVMGTAGVVMTAVWIGAAGEDVTASGADALVRAAEAREAGLDWGIWSGAESRLPNYSHGTAGIASALAVAGVALDRPKLVEAAVLGAQHLLAIGKLDDGGFVVPHTIPPSQREVEPVTYTWCHGPTGTSQLFAALAHAGVEDVNGIGMMELRQRCLRSVLDSGVPRRLRPGFWDNDGRCCGTAGVGDVLLDAAQDAQDPALAGRLLAAARVMGDALLERAIRHDAAAFWRFVEHRQDPPLLAPRTAWMQGAAGIAAFLLRLARVVEDGLDAMVIDRPDEWWAVPARLRRYARPAQPCRSVR